LYNGFSTRISVQKNEATIEWTPQSYISESVLDYVQLRKEKGASANAIVRNLTTYRNRVIVAPTGTYGSITEVITRKAGSHRVSATTVVVSVRTVDSSPAITNNTRSWFLVTVFRFKNFIVAFASYLPYTDSYSR
jgi:hypothetical protein